jgi:hypothetical protein
VKLKANMNLAEKNIGSGQKKTEQEKKSD